MRPTAPLSLGSLQLSPAGPEHLESVLAGVEQSRPEVHRALPWVEWDQDLGPQIQEYLEEVDRLGRGGLTHHWVVLEDGEMGGLVALDHTPHLVVGHWNLGYWIRNEHQGQGLAGRAIDAALDWVGRGGLTSLEIRVDPANIAGVATAESVARRWRGHRLVEGDREVEVEGEMVMHHCWLIPRLPLEASE